MKKLFFVSLLAIGSSLSAFGSPNTSMNMDRVARVISESIFDRYRCESMNRINSIHEAAEGVLRQSEVHRNPSHAYYRRYHSRPLIQTNVLQNFRRSGELLGFLQQVDIISGRQSTINRLVLSSDVVNLVEPLVEEMSNRGSSYFYYTDQGDFQTRLQMLFETSVDLYGEPLSALGAIGETFHLLGEAQNLQSQIVSSRPRLPVPFDFFNIGDRMVWLFEDADGDIPYQTRLHRSFWYGLNRTLVMWSNSWFGFGDAHRPVDQSTRYAREAARWGSDVAQRIARNLIQQTSDDAECRRLQCARMRSSMLYMSATGGLGTLNCN